MGWTNLQAVFNTVASAQTLTTTISPTQAGSLIGIVAMTTGGVGAVTFTDSANQAYKIPTSGDGFNFVGYSPGTVAGVTSITYNQTGGAGTIILLAFEYSSDSGMQTQDGVQTVNDSTGTSFDTGAMTIVGPNDLLIGWVIQLANQTITVTPNAPYSIRLDHPDGGHGVRETWFDALNITPGSYHCSGAFSSGSNGYRSGQMGFKLVPSSVGTGEVINANYQWLGGDDE